jgi:exosortase/archaeosortase family protein
MLLIRGFRDFWMSLPSEASSFLKRAILLFFLWKFLYVIVLLPSGEPDGWLVRLLGDATVTALNLFSGSGHYKVLKVERPGPDAGTQLEQWAYIYHGRKNFDIGIANPCNGLELMVLAVGFILCFQGSERRKAAYIAASLFGVFAVNVVRCSLLTVIKTSHPVYFEFAHKFLFNLSGYAFVFFLWMRYVKGAIGSALETKENMSRG